MNKNLESIRTVYERQLLLETEEITKAGNQIDELQTLIKAREKAVSALKKLLAELGREKAD